MENRSGVLAAGCLWGRNLEQNPESAAALLILTCSTIVKLMVIFYCLFEWFPSTSKLILMEWKSPFWASLLEVLTIRDHLQTHKLTWWKKTLIKSVNEADRASEISSSLLLLIFSRVPDLKGSFSSRWRQRSHILLPLCSFSPLAVVCCKPLRTSVFMLNTFFCSFSKLLSGPEAATLGSLSAPPPAIRWFSANSWRKTDLANFHAEPSCF